VSCSRPIKDATRWMPSRTNLKCVLSTSTATVTTKHREKYPLLRAPHGTGACDQRGGTADIGRPPGSPIGVCCRGLYRAHIEVCIGVCIRDSIGAVIAVPSGLVSQSHRRTWLCITAEPEFRRNQEFPEFRCSGNFNRNLEWKPGVPECYSPRNGQPNNSAGGLSCAMPAGGWGWDGKMGREFSGKALAKSTSHQIGLGPRGVYKTYYV
jgi:hypothetical protein